MTTWVNQANAVLKQDQEDQETLEVMSCYGRERILRGPLLTLQFRFRNGNIVVLEYAHHRQTTYDPSLGLEMDFVTGTKIRLSGRHLRPLLDDLSLHRVAWIQEGDEFELNESDNVTFVSKIERLDVSSNEDSGWG